MKKIIKLENFIYLTIFLLPTYLIKINFFGVPTNWLEILILIVCVWALWSKIKFRDSLKPSFRIAIAVMIIGLLLSTLINKNYIAGLGIIKGWFVLPILLAVIAKNIIPEEKKENIYGALYFSGLTVAAISLAYYILGRITFDDRLQSIFNSPNYLAMYLAPAIIIGARINGGKHKKFNLAALAVILAAFYLTYSYAAWLSVGAVLLILAAIKGKKSINSKKISLIIFTIMAVVASQWNNQKFQNLRNPTERSSYSSHIMIWRSAGKIIADNWLGGIGPGNFQNKYLEYQKYFPPYLEWAVPHPHNLYLAWWLYGGVLGLIGFLSMLFLWFKEVLARKEKDIWRWMSLGIMLYFLLHGLVDTTYFKNDLAVIFWINFWMAL